MQLPLCVLYALTFLAAPVALGQGTIDTGITLVANPASVMLGQSTTLTATLTVSSGPVSATDGLIITFQTRSFRVRSTLSNGVAQFSFAPFCGSRGCDNQVFASFLPQGNFGPSSTSIYVTVYQPTPPQFSGAYAFRFSGQSFIDGQPSDVAAVGTMVSDGNGNITGIEDVNTSVGVLNSLGFTGTYTLGINDTGTMTLTTFEGTQTYGLYLPSNAQYTVAAVSGTFIETDGFVEGNGVLLRQDQNGMNYALGNPGSTYALDYGKGTYAVDAAGSTACTNCTAVRHAAGPVAVAGQLTLSTGGGITGLVGGSVGTQLGSIVAVTGTASAFDSNGRMPFTVVVPGGASDQPSNYIAYLIDSYHFFYMSTDPHTRDILLVGTAGQKP